MKSNLSENKLREFGLLMGFVFPVLIGWILPAIWGHMFRSWTLWISIPFIILGIFRPRLLLYPYKIWIKIGHILGWVNSRLILGLVFILVLQPIALFMRVFGYDPLKKRKEINKVSYREERKQNNIDISRIF